MKNVKQLIVDTIASAVKTPLTLIDVDFDIPQSLASGSPRNTKIRVFPKPWIGVSGSYELMYDRVYYKDIRPFTIVKGQAQTVHEVIEEINHKYGYDFELEDLEDAALGIPNAQGYITFYLSFAETSKGFYSGDRILTSGEYTNPSSPEPQPPENPNWPTPILSSYPVSNTLLKSYCKEGQAWGLYTQGNQGQTREQRLVGQDNFCDDLTLTASKQEDIAQGAAIINYSFNKPLDQEVKLTYTVTPEVGQESPLAGIAYKMRGDVSWSNPTLGTTLTIPKDAVSFFVRYTASVSAIIPDQGVTIGVELNEKAPDTFITVTDPVSVQLTFKPVVVY